MFTKEGINLHKICDFAGGGTEKGPRFLEPGAFGGFC